MAKDIFGGEVEKASEDLASRDTNVDAKELPSELQEQLGNLESLVAMDPSITGTKEYQDLIARIDAHNSGADEDDEEEDEDEEEEESDDEESDDEDDDEEEAIEDDVFGILGKEKKKPKVKIDFDVPKEMEALLSSRYGVKDANTFFSSVDSWRTQAQEGAEVKKNFEALSSDIQNMPPDLRESIARWADGDDYTAPFTNGERLDFGREFEQQDVEQLVQHYLPEEYERLMKAYEKEDGMSEEDFDEKIDLLARSTKQLFSQEKKALVDERVQYQKKQSELQENLKISALDSVEALSKSFPNFSKAELSKVRNILVEGKVDNLFYNADGTYTKEAAELVANAMYGSKMRDVLTKIAKNQGASEANQKVVDSSPKTVKKQKASNTRAGVNIKAVEHLKETFDRDVYA